MTERETTWFWYGRFEGAAGGYMPPKGFLPTLLYSAGNIIGRWLGPPRSR